MDPGWPNNPPGCVVCVLCKAAVPFGPNMSEQEQFMRHLLLDHMAMHNINLLMELSLKQPRLPEEQQGQPQTQPSNCQTAINPPNINQNFIDQSYQNPIPWNMFNPTYANHMSQEAASVNNVHHQHQDDKSQYYNYQPSIPNYYPNLSYNTSSTHPSPNSTKIPFSEDFQAPSIPSGAGRNILSPESITTAVTSTFPPSSLISSSETPASNVDYSSSTVQSNNLSSELSPTSVQPPLLLGSPTDDSRNVIPEDLQKQIQLINPDRGIVFFRDLDTQMSLDGFMLTLKRGPYQEKGGRNLNWRCTTLTCEFSMQTWEGHILTPGRRNMHNHLPPSALAGRRDSGGKLTDNSMGHSAQSYHHNRFRGFVSNVRPESVQMVRPVETFDPTQLRRTRGRIRGSRSSRRGRGRPRRTQSIFRPAPKPEEPRYEIILEGINWPQIPQNSQQYTENMKASKDSSLNPNPVSGESFLMENPLPKDQNINLDVNSENSNAYVSDSTIPDDKMIEPKTENILDDEFKSSSRDETLSLTKDDSFERESNSITPMENLSLELETGVGETKPTDQIENILGKPSYEQLVNTCDEFLEELKEL